MKEEEQLRGRLKDVVCSDWTTETKDDSSFSVIGSSLGEFIGKLSEDVNLLLGIMKILF